MELKDIDIREIIPQQPPFRMVDRLLSYDETVSEATLLLRPDNIFLDDTFQTAGIVEHIAQTCAARIGYYNKYILHRDIVIGYIGAIRQLDVKRPPSVGEELLTRIEVLSSAFGMTLVSAVVSTSQGELIADGEVKIALSES
jgi:3-hydroxymyristoyl/3-hydroxydecanoyl-(acyl carrier protein) dehydratase